ncbi:MAG: 2-dehydro-3-deoxygalactonokinase, partial [Chitinophagaceae bacterium]
MENYLLGCDWGTSSFRLGLYSLADAVLVDEIQSGDGISGIHRNWQNGNYKARGISKTQLFREKLLTQINILSTKIAVGLENTPVLISGMASSSIGIDDVPYADLPFRLDGSQVKSRKLEAQEDFPHEIILISGVQGEQDVMRGEETQLIGIWSLLMDRGRQPKEAIIIFPGTHSKHVYIKDGQLIHFKTFMTGEMYQVIGNHSILKDSVKMDDAYEPSATDTQAFKMGIKNSGTTGLLNSLFTVRTNQLFNRFNKTQNTFYLSGLLIGS